MTTPAQPSFLPQTPESMSEIASQYVDLYSDISGMAAGTALQNTGLAIDFGDQVLQGNYRRFPRVVDSALGTARESTQYLNRSLANQYYANLSAADKNWGANIPGTAFQSAADSANYAINQLRDNFPQLMQETYTDYQMLQRASREQMLGIIPRDMVEQASIYAAEKAQKQGAYGQAAVNMVAKELGIQSLSQVETGIAGAGRPFELAVNPFIQQLTSLQQAQRATGTAAATVGALKNTVVNTGTMFAANFGQLTGTTMATPAVFSSGLLGLQDMNMGTAMSAWDTTAKLAQGQVEQGYLAQQWVRQQELLNKKPSPWGAVAGGAASGAATGSAAGPWGAVIGGVVGAGLGYYQSQNQ